MIRILCSLTFLFVSAASAEVPARLSQAFESWVAEVGANAAVMTIWQGDRHLKDVAIGMPADQPVELASLSKAVTALCAAQLIREGRWQPATTSLEVLGFGRAGTNVAQLLTHSAGLGPDETQQLMPMWLDTSGDRALAVARQALGRKGQGAGQGVFSYNNENYAVLGAMIAAHVGQSYASYCQNAVLAPAGITSARLSPRAGGMAAWGGWQMSVQDFARLMLWGYGPQGMIGKAPQDWPSAEMGGGATYGVGMVQRTFRGSMNYWHFGALCFPGQLNTGSFAVRWKQEWSVVVAYDRCVDWDQMFRLDNLLSRAVFR